MDIASWAVEVAAQEFGYEMYADVPENKLADVLDRAEELDQ